MKAIFISTTDHHRISKLVNALVQDGTNVPGPILKLRDELGRANVIPPDALKSTVVALNSSVALRDLETGELENWVLTMPEYADPDKQRISILAPVGTAIIGFSEGDEIAWETPGGVRSLKVEQVEHNAFSESDPSRLFGG